MAAPAGLPRFAQNVSNCYGLSLPKTDGFRICRFWSSVFTFCFFFISRKMATFSQGISCIYEDCSCDKTFQDNGIITKTIRGFAHSLYVQLRLNVCDCRCTEKRVECWILLGAEITEFSSFFFLVNPTYNTEFKLPKFFFSIKLTPNFYGTYFKMMQSRQSIYRRLLSQKHSSAVPCSFYRCYWQISENVETVQYIFVKLFILSYQKCATRFKPTNLLQRPGWRKRSKI